MAKNLTRRNGVYYARIQINGRDTWKSLRTTNGREARERLKEARQQADAARAGIAPVEEAAPTWPEAVERWAVQKLGELKDSTGRRYQTSLRQIDAFLHPTDDQPRVAIAAVDQPYLNDYVTARMGQGAKAATVRRDLTVVSQVWRVAKRAGWVSGENPALAELEEIDELRDPAKPVRLRDLARVLRRQTRMMAALSRFLVRTGCRQEEAASLELSEVDLRSAPARVTFLDTKTRNPRVVEISGRCAADLARLPRHKDTTFVFWHLAEDPERPGHHKPTRYLNVATNFSKLMKDMAAEAEEAGSDFRPFRHHDLRHTRAIRWLQGGGDIYRLSRDLGHSNVTVTDRTYAGWIRQQDREAARQDPVAKAVASGAGGSKNRAV